MRRYILRVGPVLYSFVAAVLFCLSTGGLRNEAQAQVRPRNDLESRQRALRSLEETKERPAEKVREQRLEYQQIKEDFELLQLTSFHLADVITSGPAPDYGQIGKDAAEVKKRAARLKLNLSFPEPRKAGKMKKNEEDFSAEELKSAVGTLNELVKSFVSNPFFQQPGVLNVESSERAGRDLDWIIRLSDQVQRSAEALNKSAGKSL